MNAHLESSRAGLRQLRRFAAHTVAFFGALLFLSTGRATETSSPFPHYTDDRDVFLIDEVAVARCEVGRLFTSDVLARRIHDPDATSRSSRLLSPEERRTLLKPAAPLPATSRLRVQPEQFFILWGAEDPPVAEHLAVASFVFESRDDAVWTLAVGCDYGFGVIVNDQLVYGRCGYAPFSEASDLIRCPVRKGANVIQVAFASNERQGRGSYDPSWTGRIEMFRRATDAVRRCFAFNRHPFDAPLVAKREALRCRLGSPFVRTVRILDVRSRQPLAKGTVDEQGGISWDGPAPRLEAFIADVDGQSPEPIVIANAATLQLPPPPAAAARPSDPAAAAWAFRYRHLLKPEFAAERATLRWAQKTAYAWICSEVSDAFAAPQSSLPGLQFGTYDSTIDGSRQYFQFFVPASRGPVRRVLVVVPGVTDPVRPFLEGGTVAGFDEWERWCAMAAQSHFALLWPGYNDVDYGGEYSQHELADTIQAFQRAYPDIRDVTILGVCSSAICAARHAANHPGEVASLILMSPEFKRGGYRLSPGIEDDTPNTSFQPETDAVVDQLVRRLSGTPIAIMYDSGMPGHGDKPLSDRFIELSRELGRPVDVLTAPVTHEFVWGERMVWRLRGFLEWAAAQATPALTSKSRQPLRFSEAAPEQKLIKTELLGGFAAEAPSFGEQGWFQDWRQNYQRWRGADLPIAEPPSITRGVVLRRVVLREPADWQAFPELRGHAREGESFLAIFLHPTAGRSELIVAEHGPAPEYYPRIDPLLDGYFRGSVWFFQDDSWHQGDVW